MDNPMRQVLSNELILENIFRYLPTSDILLKANRTVSKWNKVASKFVQLKRRITLTHKNVLAYCDFINNGGVGAKFIKLNLVYLDDSLARRDVQKIISIFSEIGGNVRKLKIGSGGWENNAAANKSDSPTQLEARLFSRLLLCCKNIEQLFITIKFNFLTIPNVYNLLNLRRLKALPNLKKLSIILPTFCERVLSAFLEAAPNIHLILPLSGLDLQDLQILETKFPKVLEKFGFFSNAIHLNVQLADFLINRNFSSLAELWINRIEDFPSCERIMEKYADQLVKLSLNLTWIPDDGGDDLELQNLILPSMKNLKTMRWEFKGMECYEPHFAIPSFSGKDRSESIFPNLLGFYLELPDFLVEYRESEDLLEQICVETFGKPPSHPVFPNARKFFVSTGLAQHVGVNALKIKPKVFEAVRKYFPSVEFDFVVDENEN